MPDRAEDVPNDASPVQDGPRQTARARALTLAKAQATDAEIEAVLRTVYSACRPQVLTPCVVGRIMTGVRPALNDARITGRLEVAETLHATARGSDSQVNNAAAIHLSRRIGTVDKLGKDTERKRRQLLGMGEEEMLSELGKLAESLGLELVARST